MTDREELERLIEEQLDLCCPRSLDTLHRYIQSREGREQVAQMLFGICEKDGISVQSAMAQLDSEL